jgi:DNA polymerase-1
VNLVPVMLQVAEIDVKKESPVGHGRITCITIFCGPSANFGDGKNRLWVDVLDGGEGILQVFKRYFEDPCINKVGFTTACTSLPSIS